MISKRYLIVGIDPGIKTGYAVLDLNGNLVASGVEKEANEERVVEIVREFGIPSIIGTDVASPPYFVRKIAARFNIRVHFPSKNITGEEKREIGKEIDNVHIRDAYSAAVKAFRTYANRLRQIELMDIKEKDRLKHLVIQGEQLGRVIQNKNGAYL
ncbi:DUF460 domain-containing protein [Candidatus Micrarchaeota archaeon]|nr:DUF460 domain-containing protein [Candidatus Micrarchaeota archaeon]